MINRTDAVTRMRSLVEARTPWIHQGRTPIGLDCVGAIVFAFEYSGEVPPYPQDPVNGELERELNRVFGPPSLYRVSLMEPPFDSAQLLAGDVVSMQYAGPVRHVAMVADHVALPGQRSVIHTSASLGRVTEHILDMKWLRRIVGVWRP